MPCFSRGDAAMILRVSGPRAFRLVPQSASTKNLVANNLAA